MEWWRRIIFKKSKHRPCCQFDFTLNDLSRPPHSDMLDYEAPRPDAERVLTLARVGPCCGMHRLKHAESRTASGRRVAPAFRPGQSLESDISLFVLASIQKTQSRPTMKEKRR